MVSAAPAILEEKAAQKLKDLEETLTNQLSGMAKLDTPASINAKAGLQVQIEHCKQNRTMLKSPDDQIKVLR